MDGMLQNVRVKLFVSGATALSVKAILAVKEACFKIGPNSVDLEIIDVLQSKGVMREEELLPLPSLFVSAQDMVKRFIGSEIESSVLANEIRSISMQEACL